MYLQSVSRARFLMFLPVWLLLFRNLLFSSLIDLSGRKEHVLNIDSESKPFPMVFLPHSGSMMLRILARVVETDVSSEWWSFSRSMLFRPSGELKEAIFFYKTKIFIQFLVWGEVFTKV